MKTNALTSTVFALTAATLFGQGKSDVEFLRARTDAHEAEDYPARERDYQAESLPWRKANHDFNHVDFSPRLHGWSYVVKKGDILTRIAYSP